MGWEAQTRLGGTPSACARPESAVASNSETRLPDDLPSHRRNRRSSASAGSAMSTVVRALMDGSVVLRISCGGRSADEVVCGTFREVADSWHDPFGCCQRSQSLHRHSRGWTHATVQALHCL